jgi:predicted AlkP superfamily pyrophosphatase or phosphodiesterase
MQVPLPVRTGLLIIVLFICHLTRAETPRASHVVIISYDMGGADLMKTADMPVFQKLLSESAYTWNAYTIGPSVTLPSHTSMLTGVGIQKHQITWNEWQPEKPLVQVPTIFALARQHGYSTMMLAGKEKFRQLVVPDTLDTFAVSGTARQVGDAFAAAAKITFPNLAFLHFADPDTIGHKFGARSPEQLAAFKECDLALHTILQTINASPGASRTVLIVTAEHGAHNIVTADGKTVATHGTADTADVVIPWIAWGAGVKRQHEITAPVVTYDTAATALWLLGIPVPEHVWGRPITAAFDQSATAEP